MLLSIGNTDVVANKEKMIQARTIIAPSRQTEAKPLIKLIPVFCVGSPAKVELGFVEIEI